MLYFLSIYTEEEKDSITKTLTGCYNTLSVFEIEIEIEIVYFT